MSWKARLGTLSAFIAGAIFVSAAPVFLHFAAGFVRPVHHYRVVFDGSVSGLSEGAPVQRNGVEVGKVTSVELTDDASPRVIVAIEVNHGVKVMRDSVASISGSLLTGARSVEIVGGSRAAGILREGNEIRSDEAASSASDSTVLDSSEFPSGAGKGFFGRSRAVVSQGSADFSQAGRTLKLVANNLSSPERWRSIDSTLANLNSASAHLSQTMERVDVVVDSFAARRDQLYGQVDATLARLNQTLDQANQLLATSNHLIKSSNEMISTTAIAIERNGGQIEQTLGEIDRTSHHLDETLETIGPNPSTILWGSKREPK